MGVYIKGMEMPHDCEECKLCVIIPVGDYQIFRKCVALNKRAEYVIRRKDCPLIEVPQHGDLIDRDALCEGRVSNDNVSICAKAAPVIIPAEEGGI